MPCSNPVHKKMIGHGTLFGVATVEKIHLFPVHIHPITTRQVQLKTEIVLSNWLPAWDRVVVSSSLIWQHTTAKLLYW